MSNVRAGGHKRTEAERADDVNRTREGLIGYLTARRERVGMTSQDLVQSPERVLEKQYDSKLHREQQRLLAEYLQTQDSDNTM